MFFFQETNEKQTRNKQINRPRVGDTVYFVGEHLYYPEDNSKHYVEKEFYVYTGIVEAVYTYPNSKRKPDCKVLYGLDGECKGSLHYPRLSDFGEKIFFDRESACKLAEKKTDEYEKTWAILGAKLRRPWREST